MAPKVVEVMSWGAKMGAKSGDVWGQIGRSECLWGTSWRLGRGSGSGRGSASWPFAVAHSTEAPKSIVPPDAFRMIIVIARAKRPISGH